MIQGGDPQGIGMGGPGYQFEDETSSPHRIRKIRKARHGQRRPQYQRLSVLHHGRANGLADGKHTIFGEVVEGYDVVEKIAKAPRNRQDRPNTEVVVKSVKIER